MTDPAPGRKSAVLLDVDGTLLDTVYLHVHAWWESFEAAGRPVRAQHVHRAIGKGAQDLVADLLPGAAPSLVESVVDGHARRWAPLRSRCHAYAGARELLAALRQRGLRTALATSGSDDDVEAFLDLLGGRDAVDEVVGDSEVEGSKPAPDIVREACRRLGVDPAEAVVVGDTAFDMQAAVSAGATGVGVRCGGIPDEVLREASASLVVDDPAALLADLDAWCGASKIG
jgi:HAD superfamily hydrolase (TIGR01509 family)